MKVLKRARSKGALVLSVSVILFCTMTAAAQSASDKCRPAGVIPLAGEPPAKIVIDPPLPGPLASRGVAIIQYCAENLHLVPVFGPGALTVSPRVGHLHVRVDDAEWVWADASGSPIILMGLPPGPHEVSIELEDANHHALDKGTVAFVVPAKSAPRQPETKRVELQRHDLSAPGREVFQVRVDFDPGYAFPRHTHPGEEIVYVLEGTLEYHVGGKPAGIYKAGDVLFIPAGTIHWVKNVGSGTGSELATYVVEKGKPLITLVGDADSKPMPVSPSEVKGMIITSIQYTFAAKDADKAESLFQELRAASVLEPGVIQFEVGRSKEDPNVFALWEVYRDKDAADAHLASEHFKRLVLNGIRPLAQQRTAATVVPIHEKQ